MEEYKVTVSLTSTTAGSMDQQYPDNTVSIVFDASDATIEVMLEKYKDFMNAMGYVLGDRHLEIADSNPVADERYLGAAIKNRRLEEEVQILKEQLRDAEFNVLSR
jgi:hypothetical protein